MMMEVLLSLLAGLLIGVFFSFLRLPLPSPGAFAGIVGILGMFLGGQLYQYLIKFFQ